MIAAQIEDESLYEQLIVVMSSKLSVLKQYTLE
jgi:hypothetical protein